MSSRPLITPFPVLVNADMSGNLTSKVTIIKMLSMASYSLTWAGTAPVGTINVQVSNDYTQNEDGSVANAGSWNTLPLSVTASVSGNTGTGFIDLDQLAAFAIRLTYAFTSGTGLMNATIVSKVA